MPMADKNTPIWGPEQFTEATRKMMGFNPLMSTGASQFRHLWAVQDKILGDFEELAQKWCERRHEANRTAVEATKAMSKNGGNDLPEAMRLMNEWLTKSMARLSEDARDNYEFCMRCTNHLANEGMAAGEQLAETAQEQMKPGADVPGSSKGSEEKGGPA